MKKSGFWYKIDKIQVSHSGESCTHSYMHYLNKGLRLSSCMLSKQISPKSYKQINKTPYVHHMCNKIKVNYWNLNKSVEILTNTLTKSYPNLQKTWPFIIFINSPLFRDIHYWCMAIRKKNQASLKEIWSIFSISSKPLHRTKYM